MCPGSGWRAVSGRLSVAQDECGYSLEQLVLVDDLDAMLVLLARGILADRGEVGVHHQGGRRWVFDVAGTSIAVDLEVLGHGCGSGPCTRSAC